MDPELAKLLTTLGVAAVGVGGTALGAWLNQRGARQLAERVAQSQAGLDFVRDQRALRDAQRERLGKIYQSALVAAVAMQHYASVLATRPIGWDVGQDEEKIALESVLRDTDMALAGLKVEAEAEPVSAQFDQLFIQFTALRRILTERLGDPQVSHTEIGLCADKFRDGVTQLRLVIHTSLAPLDAPIQSLARTQPRQ